MRDTQKKLQLELSLLTDAVREQHVNVSFDKLRLDRLTRSLRLKMSEFAINPSDLANSGLGYANLLFLASVVLELSNVDESELTLFLVEEPEAHLHPQLQAVLLDYLRDQARKSVQGDETGPAGRIQIIATTHSPNLASNAGLDAVVIVQSETIAHENEHTTERATHTLALAELPLGDDDKSRDKGKRKINQYLDVTRAELLFARHVIIVEGIAEQIIIPALAKNVVLRGGEDPCHDKERQRRFHGVSVISVGSVDFEPYIRLLLQQVNGRRLVERLVIVTDRDPLVKKGEATVTDEDTPSVNAITPDAPDAPDAETENEDEGTVDYNRASDLRKLVTELHANDIVYIAEAPHTLEADLIDPVADNREVFGRALLAQKPRSKKTWATLADAADPAQTFYEKLQANKKFISKGQFAHDFAIELENPGTYKCPDYLIRAITFAIGEGTKE